MFNQDMMRYLSLMQQFQPQQQGGGLLSPQDEKQSVSQSGGMGLLSLLGLPMGGAIDLLKNKRMGIDGGVGGMNRYGDIFNILKMFGDFNGTP